MESTENSISLISNHKYKMCMCDFYALKTPFVFSLSMIFLKAFYVQSHGPTWSHLQLITHHLTHHLLPISYSFVPQHLSHDVLNWWISWPLLQSKKMWIAIICFILATRFCFTNNFQSWIEGNINVGSLDPLYYLLQKSMDTNVIQSRSNQALITLTGFDFTIFEMVELIQVFLW